MYFRGETGAGWKVYNPLTRSSASTACIASLTSFFVFLTLVLTVRYQDPGVENSEVASVVTMPS